MALPSSDAVAFWWHYEELAMHLNSLMIQFRVQVLGGAGAIGSLAGYLIDSTYVKDEKQGFFSKLLALSSLFARPPTTHHVFSC